MFQGVTLLCAFRLLPLQVPAAAAEAGAVCGPGWPSHGALLQADPAYLQPVHHTVRHNKGAPMQQLLSSPEFVCWTQLRSHQGQEVGV